MYRKSLAIAIAVSLLASSLAISASSSENVDSGSRTGSKSGKPLSIQAVEGASELEDFHLSPDGAWVAQSWYSTSGEKTHLSLTEVDTGRIVQVGATTESAAMGRAPWSPDGRYLAYVSYEQGVPILSLWDRTSQSSRALRQIGIGDNGVFVNWFSDSRHFLVSLWPKDLERPHDSDASESNENVFRPPFQAGDSREARVYVYQSIVDSSKSGTQSAVTEASGKDRCGERIVGRCDLGIVDVQTDTVLRVATAQRLTTFQEASPNGKYVAYTTWNERHPITRSFTQDLHIVDLDTGTDRTLGTKLHAGNGGVSWAPDSEHIAYSQVRVNVEGVVRRDAPADLVVLSLRGKDRLEFHRSDSLPLYGNRRILWSENAKKLYAVGPEGSLWEFDLRSRASRSLSPRSDVRLRDFVTPDDSSKLSVLADSDTIWVSGEEPKSGASGLYELSLRKGSLTRAIDLTDRKVASFSSDRKMKSVVFRHTASQRPEEVTLWRIKDRQSKRLEGPNNFLDDFALGAARRIEWHTASGQQLAGALLLPPNYEPGQKVPLVVWVYGGTLGSQAVNKFGLATGAEFNMQVLATRGYAVLFPDAPQRLGHPMEDLLTAVMPGVDEVIREGIADSERLAVMGHSYGAYSTLALITQTPRFKAAVISGVPHPDLIGTYLLMNGNGVSYEAPIETGYGLMGVTPWQDPDRYRANSPLYGFDKIETPLLIGQGDIDSVTPMVGAHAVFVALRRLGKPVEYRVYRGIGHGFGRPFPTEDFWNRRLEFLSQTLNVAVDADGKVILEGGRAKARTASSSRQ